MFFIHNGSSKNMLATCLISIKIVPTKTLANSFYPKMAGRTRRSLWVIALPKAGTLPRCETDRPPLLTSKKRLCCLCFCSYISYGCRSYRSLFFNFFLHLFGWISPGVELGPGIKRPEMGSSQSGILQLGHSVQRLLGCCPVKIQFIASGCKATMGEKTTYFFFCSIYGLLGSFEIPESNHWILPIWTSSLGVFQCGCYSSVFLVSIGITNDF